MMHGVSVPRTIIIGDVHGCYAELEALLAKLQVGASDRLISVGDLICKGPDSLAVMQWAMGAQNLQCVQGNHEARFLKYWKQGKIPDEKPYDRETYEQLEPIFEQCMQFIDSWPLYLEEPDFLVVHAGLDPRLGPLSRQRPHDLLNIRLLEGVNSPWFESYVGDKRIVFGHWARQVPVMRANAVGLDTGCVYGGELSAWVLPEGRLVSVPSGRIYREKDSWSRAASRRKAHP